MEDRDPFQLDPHLGELRRRLSELPPPYPVAFAAACAERLYPHFASFAASRGLDTERIRWILERVWAHAAGDTLAAGEASELARECEDVELDEDDGSDDWDGSVDALGCLWLALSACVDDSAENAARAGGTITDRVDVQLMRDLAGECDSLSPRQTGALHNAIDAHPLMIAERERLARQLDYLAGFDRLTVQELRPLREGLL